MLSIKNFIKERGISQAAFAREIGVSEAMVSFCISGKRRIGLSVALRIKKVTGLSLDEIYRGTK